LAAEYSVDVLLDGMPYELAFWVDADDGKVLAQFADQEASRLARDTDGDLVFLAASRFWMERAMEKWPQVRFNSTKEHN
jgi:peptide chain release factor 3